MIHKKELQDLGITKIPSSDKIQKRIENHESEQVNIFHEKQKLQKKPKILNVIQQNFTSLFDFSHLPMHEYSHTLQVRYYSALLTLF